MLHSFSLGILFSLFLFLLLSELLALLRVLHVLFHHDACPLAFVLGLALPVQGLVVAHLLQPPVRLAQGLAHFLLRVLEVVRLGEQQVVRHLGQLLDGIVPKIHEPPLHVAFGQCVVFQLLHALRDQFSATLLDLVGQLAHWLDHEGVFGHGDGAHSRTRPE